MLWKQSTDADLADRVTRTADSLKSTGGRFGRLNQEHQINGTHVDAKLEGTGRDDRGKLTALELFFNEAALGMSEAAVMSPSDWGARNFANPLGQPFGECARVDEHDGLRVSLDLVDQRRENCRPHPSVRAAFGRWLIGVEIKVVVVVAVGVGLGVAVLGAVSVGVAWPLSAALARVVLLSRLAARQRRLTIDQRGFLGAGHVPLLRRRSACRSLGVWRCRRW